ncbi:MAG: HAMP domain-containing sensor histidine kinase [Chloroflexota bacterium]|nr:HAMP domain-containing sensor histidine kinase [Chloroflexota bacterium]
MPDGRSITALMSVTSIRSEEDEVESVVVTLQDMTPLEELERLVAEFLTMVRHELRAPLASIKGSAATLIGSGDSLDPAEALRFHRIVDDQAEHMRGLITDLLDVARIETGTLSTSPEASEPSLLVDRARNSYLSGGGRNQIHIDTELDLPQVMADQRRIVQVLVNLLSNAAGRSPESSVITVSARTDGVHVVFSVADEGVGVPAERLPHLLRSTHAMTRRTLAASRAREWGWQSARGSWKPTGAGCGQRAKDTTGVPFSPSYCLWREMRDTRNRKTNPTLPACRADRGGDAPVSWWSTTTCRRSGTPGKLSRRRASPPR